MCDHSIKNKNHSKIENNFTKRILIVAGSFCLMLGIIGIFLPLLPTTPFLLLSAACYFRASERAYHWLINTKWLGNYIRNYREGKGIPLIVKIITISLLWITIGFSALFVVQILLIRIILFLIATGVTIHILSIRTLKNET